MNNGFKEIGRTNIQAEEPIAGTSSDTMTIMSVLLSVLKRPWIIFLSLIIILAPLLYYLVNISTVYRSSSTVMVSVRESSFLDAVSLVEGTRSDVKSEKYYTSILDSRAYRDDVRNQIAGLHPEMPIDSLSRLVAVNIGYDRNPREPGFIEIYANSQSKVFSHVLAKTALDKFIARSIGLEREDAMHISTFINNQIESISKKLEQAEEDLQSFLTRNKLLVIGIESGVTQELFDLERNLNEAKANLEMTRINIASYDQQMSELLSKLTDESKTIDEDRINRIKGRLSEIRKTLDLESAELTKAEMQVLTVERDRLRSELIGLVSPTVPDESSGISNVGITIQRLEEELGAALIKQTDFQNKVQFYGLQIERFRKDHPNISEDILTYASLSRAKEVLRKTLDILLEKREEVQIRIESEMGGIKVIDSPRVPDNPIPRKRMQKLILGILVAFSIGIILSVVLDRFDNTIKDENDIHQAFGLSVFGTIPSLDSNAYVERYSYSRHRSGSEDKRDEIATSSKNPTMSRRLISTFSEKSPAAEAYRSLKIAIQFLANDRQKKVFVISSPSVSEGKSLTTANLSISFAQGGSKTLVVDCDLRKTAQHKYFEIERKPGLTNYLYGEAELKDVIRNPQGIPNLDIITSGSSPSNPAELLASQKMKNFVEDMRQRYDFILIDTPPILVCSDSRVLAESADGMILIAKVESTNIKALDHSINLTKHLNIELLGMILNQVEFRFGRAYYYTYRYYRPYSYYSGYYYKRQYYDYTETETGEKVKIPRSGKGVRTKRTSSKKRV